LANIFIYVLGTAQDGGYPHAGCEEDCCNLAWENPSLKRLPSSIALINKSEKKYWLFDVTPDIKEQIHMLNQFNCSLAGVFITHAHSGHYMGLINFGLEVMNLDNIPVYTMPRMRDYIKSNSMLNQLILNKNINIQSMQNEKRINLSQNIFIKPFDVPHRNELSETVGFEIRGSKQSIIYLPDIDSWDGFEDKLSNIIKKNDILFIDGTFFTKDEIVNRDISKIPHPEILETISHLSYLSDNDKKKIYFIHFNHTNKILSNKESYDKVLDLGFSISKEGQLFEVN